MIALDNLTNCKNMADKRDGFIDWKIFTDIPTQKNKESMAAKSSSDTKF